MATKRFLVSTPMSEVRPLMFQGASVYSSHPQVTALVRARLGPEHALLFAEPMADPNKHTIDWYAGANGPIRKLASLSPEEQDAVRTRIETLTGAIAGIAEGLEGSKDHSEKAIGGILQLAIKIATDDGIYLVGSQPVVAGWGCSAAGTTAAQQTLTRQAAKVAPVTPPVSPGLAPRPPVAPPPPVAPRVTPSLPPPPEAPAIANRASRFPWTILAFFFAGLVITGLLLAGLAWLFDRRPDQLAMLSKLRAEEVVLRQERDRLLLGVGEACYVAGGAPCKVISATPLPVVVIFDASSSMDQEINASGTTRFQSAKQAIHELASAIPTEIGVDLVAFADCGKFLVRSGKRRDEILSAVDGLATKGGTPLAESIRLAGAMLSERHPNKALMVLVTDGDGDSCEGDIRASVDLVHHAIPGLTINVVGLIGSSSAYDDIVGPTGGRVVLPGEGIEFPRALRQATSEVCR